MRNHPIEIGITGRIIQTGKPLRTGNVKENKYYVEWYEDTKSEMAVPLKNAFGGIIGVLNLESTFPNFFTQQQENLCLSLASAASEAIQQSDLIINYRSLQMSLEGNNIEELLQNALKNLNKMLGANTYSSVNLYDQNNDDFYSFYAEGSEKKFIDKYLIVPPRENGTARYVLNKKQVLYYNDTNNIPDGLPKLRQEAISSGIHSFAAIPLQYESNILGILFIHKLKEKLNFTEDAKAILEAFATQTAQIIYNAQHLVKIDLYKEILEKTVSGTREEILRLVVEKATEFMVSEYAAVWLFEQESGDLVRQMHCTVQGEEDNLDLEFDRIKSDEPRINITVYNTGKPVIVSDVRKIDNYKSVYTKALSEIAVPLRFGNKIIGTLNTISQRLGAFSNIGAVALQTFADVAAIAINNAKAYEQRLLDITALQEINSAIGQKPVQEIHNLIAQKAEELTGATHSALSILDPEKKFLNITATSGREEKDISLPVDENSINGFVAITEKAYICNDTENDPHYHRLYSDIGSNLAVPIMFGNHLIGTLDVESVRKHAYGEDQAKLLQSLADQAGIAIKLPIA